MTLNHQLITDNGPSTVVNLMVGDASSTGLSSILNRENFAARIFSEEEKQTRSTYLKLSNVHYSLLSFIPMIKNSSVKCLVDSQSAARIVETGSTKEDLQWFAREIFHICFENNSTLKVDCIPGLHQGKLI